MPVEAACECGARYTLPDACLGTPVECRVCKKAYVIPGRAGQPASAEPPGEGALQLDIPAPTDRSPETPETPETPSCPIPSRRPLGALSLAAVLILVGGLGGAALLLPRSRNQPAAAGNESPLESYRSPSEVFAAGTDAAIYPPADVRGVRAALESLAASLAADAGAGFPDQFHLRRMLAQMETSGSAPKPRTAVEEANLLKGLRRALEWIARAQAGSPLQWREFRTIKVGFLPHRGEAEVLCSVRSDLRKSKVRFWLIKEDETWRFFDFESVEEGLRLTLNHSPLSALLTAKAEALSEYDRVVAELRTSASQRVSGDLPRALQTLREARAPSPPPGLLPLMDCMEASLLNAVGRFEETLKVLDGAPAGPRGLPAALYLQGVACHGLGRHEEAIRAQEEFLKRVGSDSSACCFMGRSLEDLGRTDEAITAYRKGIAADDEETDNRSALGRLYLALGDFGKAKALFLEVCRRDPPSGKRYEAAASELLRAEAYRELLELSLDQARRHPQDAAAYVEQGCALRRLARYGEAERALRAALEREPGHPRGQDELVRAITQQGRSGAALAYVDALALSPKEGARELYLRMTVYAIAQRDDEAIRALQTLLAREPGWHARLEEETEFRRLRALPACQELLSQAKESAARKE